MHHSRILKVDECERLIENLTEQNKKLLDEGLELNFCDAFLCSM